MAMVIEKIKVPEHLEKFVGQIREWKGFKTNAEVVEYLLPISASRLNATRRYGNKLKKEAAANPKPAKKKAAPKAAPVKKAAKKVAAKGPLARKQASTAKAPVRRKKGAGALQEMLSMDTAKANLAAAEKPAEPVLD